MSGTHYSKLIKEDTTLHSVSVSQSYFNVSNVKAAPTHTTTTTSRTTTKGSSWGRFGYSGAKDSKLVSQPLTMQSLDQMVFIHGRPKREILGGITLGVATEATAMGVYNRAQIIALKNELFEVKDNVGRLFEVVQDYSKNMLAIKTGFNELRTTLFYQVMFNPTLFDTRLTCLENQLRSRLSRVTHAMQAAMHQRFAIDYLNPAELQTLFRRLEAKANEAGCDLLIKYHSDLFQVESSLLFDSHDGHILIHVPMAPRNTLLRLFRLHPFPLPMFDTHHLMLDVKNDMLGISSTDTKYNIQLSSADLTSCHRINQVFMCDSFGVMSRRFNDTCLGALYMQKFGVVKDLCKFKVVPMSEQVYQVKKGLFLVYAPEPRNADLVCRNTSHPETHLELHLAKGTQQIRIPSGCQAHFAEHLATSDYSIRLDSEIVHFEWDWDPLTLFPAGEIEEMAETLKNLSGLNLQHTDLAHLQYITKIKEAEHNSEFGFNKLDVGLSDLASRIFGGLTTLGAGFSTIVLIAGAIFLCSYCRRSGLQPGYAGPQVILPQAVVPQVAPAPAQPVYQPPSQSTYQAPSSAGHVYQYISPRQFRQRRSRSRLGCCGSRSSEDDAVGYSAQTEELAYLDNRSKIKYQVPKYIADEANAAGRRTRSHKTYATPSSATAAPSAPSHGDLQSHLNTLATECPRTTECEVFDDDDAEKQKESESEKVTLVIDDFIFVFAFFHLCFLFYIYMSLILSY
jgi:hypothetical protein